MIIAALVMAISMPSEKFIDAVAYTESGMDYAAVGDSGRAIGAWQIWATAWETANQFRDSHGFKRINRQTATPSEHREIARWLLAWHIHRLRQAGIQTPTAEQIYLSFAMGFYGFSKINFNPQNVGRIHKRALTRLNFYINNYE